MNKEKEFAKSLINFIQQSPSSFHVVKSVEEILQDNGFNEIKLEEVWNLEKEGKYYIIKNKSAIIAFEIGKGEIEQEGFRLIGAHTDAPCFRIKPNPEMVVEDKYLKLNTEVYGGPILNTWFDRPLSLAGRVSIKADNPLNPEEKLVDFKEPLMIIPNLAIHMNRKINEGIKINPQIDTLPLLAIIDDKFKKDNFLLKLIAERLDIKKVEDILDFELFLYNTEEGFLVGLNEEFISIGRLDDLAMVHAGLYGFVNSKVSQATNVLVCFDNEEVGSATKQGAASPMLRTILERIALSLGKDKEDYYRALSKSFLISADMAHALHPNYTDKQDPTNRPIINGGPTIKISASQSYTTDSLSSAIYEGICKSIKVPVQKFVNRSDERGGSTIGPISSTQLDIPSVDIGNPILAMHSIRELGGVLDHHYVYRTFKEFYSV
ncbi:aspartyl aminopeptidase [Keratinibaculum paraultunense]|uniref:M18 family aminopeptidase n=1 Tax=Keratinibaculum paraultunense TaxID=1278232 RepID=A0A4R3L102_9FIRM|nr:M18 family aminopeptidase [Keratinibaculum paraultunense]QQY78998.1 M18 family aminopeptidase [Keratinibaculum paraultunense]TCS90620.1 aspartyl aminopeptidase [Keratinibaculum paraultunense]